MKRIIYLICFLVVIFHAWNPGAPVLSSKEISNLLIPEIEKVIEVGTSDFYETFTSDEFGLCRYENRQDRRYIFLDINNDVLDSMSRFSAGISNFKSTLIILL